MAQSVGGRELLIWCWYFDAVKRLYDHFQYISLIRRWNWPGLEWMIFKPNAVLVEYYKNWSIS